MSDITEPDILVRRLHHVAVRYGLTIKDMAEKCGIPKSSLEGYMRLNGAKRPGIDALITIADTFSLSLDWLVGRSEGEQLGEAERRVIILAVHKLLGGVLLDIEKAQAQTEEFIVKDGKIGNRDIDDYAQRMMLNFLATENLFPSDRFDTFRIINELLEATDTIPEGASN